MNLEHVRLIADIRSFIEKLPQQPEAEKRGGDANPSQQSSSSNVSEATAATALHITCMRFAQRYAEQLASAASIDMIGCGGGADQLKDGSNVDDRNSAFNTSTASPFSYRQGYEELAADVQRIHSNVLGEEGNHGGIDCFSTSSSDGTAPTTAPQPTPNTIGVNNDDANSSMKNNTKEWGESDWNAWYAQRGMAGTGGTNANTQSSTAATLPATRMVSHVEKAVTTSTTTTLMKSVVEDKEGEDDDGLDILFEGLADRASKKKTIAISTTVAAAVPPPPHHIPTPPSAARTSSFAATATANAAAVAPPTKNAIELDEIRRLTAAKDLFTAQELAIITAAIAVIQQLEKASDDTNPLDIFTPRQTNKDGHAENDNHHHHLHHDCFSMGKIVTRPSALHPSIRRAAVFDKNEGNAASTIDEYYTDEAIRTCVLKLSPMHLTVASSASATLPSTIEKDERSREAAIEVLKRDTEKAKMITMDAAAAAAKNKGEGGNSDGAHYHLAGINHQAIKNRKIDIDFEKIASLAHLVSAFSPATTTTKPNAAEAETRREQNPHPRSESFKQFLSLLALWTRFIVAYAVSKVSVKQIERQCCRDRAESEGKKDKKKKTLEEGDAASNPLEILVGEAVSAFSSSPSSTSSSLLSFPYSAPPLSFSSSPSSKPSQLIRIALYEFEHSIVYKTLYKKEQEDGVAASGERQKEAGGGGSGTDDVKGGGSELVLMNDNKSSDRQQHQQVPLTFEQFYSKNALLLTAVGKGSGGEGAALNGSGSSSSIVGNRLTKARIIIIGRATNHDENGGGLESNRVKKDGGGGGLELAASSNATSASKKKQQYLDPMAGLFAPSAEDEIQTTTTQAGDKSNNGGDDDDAAISNNNVVVDEKAFAAGQVRIFKALSPSRAFNTVLARTLLVALLSHRYMASLVDTHFRTLITAFLRNETAAAAAYNSRELLFPSSSSSSVAAVDGISIGLIRHDLSGSSNSGNSGGVNGGSTRRCLKTSLGSQVETSRLSGIIHSSLFTVFAARSAPTTSDSSVSSDNTNTNNKNKTDILAQKRAAGEAAATISIMGNGNSANSFGSGKSPTNTLEVVSVLGDWRRICDTVLESTVLCES